MTCKICFGDQTMWRRDANGKAIEVPCACVAVPSPSINVLVPTEAAPMPAGVTFTKVLPRPTFDELRKGDVVWLPALVWRDKTDNVACAGFQINGLLDINASVYLTQKDYDELPHCPVTYPYPSPIHASKRAPTEADGGNYGRVLIWDKSHQYWYPVYWDGIPLGVDVWWVPWPNLPTPPEQP